MLYTAKATQTKQAARTYATSLAQSIVDYAKIDPIFNTHAIERTKKLLPGSKHEIEIKSEPTPLLTLTSREQAIERLDWLLRELPHYTLPGFSTATAMLTEMSAASLRKTEPIQSPVFGIVGIAIIGPTLGELKKKKKSPMNIIARQDLAYSETEMIGFTTNVTHGVLQRSLTHVGGNSHHLEPEMHEWFYDDQSLVLSKATVEVLTDIQSELRVARLPHAILSDEKGLTMIAISPVANQDYIEEAWELEFINQQ